MTIKQMAKALMVSTDCVRARMRKHNIEFLRIGSDYPQYVFDTINYKPWGNIDKSKPIVKNAKFKIQIIEEFLKGGNNTSPEISKRTGIHLKKVELTLNEYLKKKCIIVESKLNFLTLEQLHN